MNTALILYDATGRVLLVSFGETELPQGVPFLFADVPNGQSVERIDLSDPTNPVAIFSGEPETDLDKIRKDIEALKDNSEIEDKLAAIEKILSDLVETQAEQDSVLEFLLGIDEE